MSHSIQPVAASAPQRTTPIISDRRPTADAAAIARDPQPEIPLPIPSSIGQSAIVTESKISTTKVVEIERTLKPYGVTMLPERVDENNASGDAPQPDPPQESDPD